MFYIIEKESQLQHIPPFDKCFVHVITNNNNYHPAIAEVSLVYVKPFDSKGYIFCIKHTESLSLKWQSIKKYLSTKDRKEEFKKVAWDNWDSEINKFIENGFSK